MQNKLYYVFDPLCGWCFGFSPVIKALETEYNSKIQFETLCGGMVLGERIKPLSEMRDYLKDAMPRLEEMTGVTFGGKYLAILEKGDLMLNSETPSIAMIVYKSMTPKSSVEFASALQQHLYVEGHNLNELASYESLVKSFDLDWDVFKEKMQLKSYKEKAFAEFKLTGEMGVQGFPSVVLKIKDKAYLIARGYRPLAEMKAVIEELIKKEEIE
ncbi:MAG: putative protein-disulfide isomerase [Marivirga sp.]|jgi:putative protein-disulfide isomerase